MFAWMKSFVTQPQPKRETATTVRRSPKFSDEAANSLEFGVVANYISNRGMAIVNSILYESVQEDRGARHSLNMADRASLGIRLPCDSTDLETTVRVRSYSILERSGSSSNYRIALAAWADRGFDIATLFPDSSEIVLPLPTEQITGVFLCHNAEAAQEMMRLSLDGQIGQDDDGYCRFVMYDLTQLHRQFCGPLMDYHSKIRGSVFSMDVCLREAISSDSGRSWLRSSMENAANFRPTFFISTLDETANKTVDWEIGIRLWSRGFDESTKSGRDEEDERDSEDEGTHGVGVMIAEQPTPNT